MAFDINEVMMRPEMQMHLASLRGESPDVGLKKAAAMRAMQAEQENAERAKAGQARLQQIAASGKLTPELAMEFIVLYPDLAPSIKDMLKMQNEQAMMQQEMQMNSFIYGGGNSGAPSMAMSEEGLPYSPMGQGGVAPQMMANPDAYNEDGTPMMPQSSGGDINALLQEYQRISNTPAGATEAGKARLSQLQTMIDTAYKMRPSESESAKEAQIARAMNDLGMTRQEAVKYADGLIEVRDDKDTGQPYVYDLTTGEYRLLQAPLPDLGITLPESEAKQGVPQTLAEALPLGTGVWSSIANVLAAGAGQFGEDLAPEVVQARAMFDNAERGITKAVAINPERPLAIDIKNVQKIFSGASMKSPTQAKNQLVVLKQQIINQLREDVAIYRNTSAPYNVRQESAARATELNKVLETIGDVENVPLGSPKAAVKSNRRTQQPKANNGGFSIRRLD